MRGQASARLHRKARGGSRALMRSKTSRSTSEWMIKSLEVARVITKYRKRRMLILTRPLVSPRWTHMKATVRAAHLSSEATVIIRSRKRKKVATAGKVTKSTRRILASLKCRHQALSKIYSASLIRLCLHLSQRYQTATQRTR